MKRNRKPWCAVPVDPLIALLPSLKWRAGNGAPVSSNAAALILYVTLIFVADAPDSADPANVMHRATVSYRELSILTGLSRALIAAGLKQLVELELIAVEGSQQDRVYLIQGKAGRWFKLPCMALFVDGRITPFRQLTRRAKVDLHALKLYLYFASVRDKQRMYSMASHEVIHTKTGIPEADIRRAHSLLTSVGLLAGIGREHKGVVEKTNEPNRYYLRGYEAFAVGTAKAA